VCVCVCVFIESIRSLHVIEFPTQFIHMTVSFSCRMNQVGVYFNTHNIKISVASSCQK